MLARIALVDNHRTQSPSSQPREHLKDGSGRRSSKSGRAASTLKTLRDSQEGTTAANETPSADPRRSGTLRDRSRALVLNI